MNASASLIIGTNHLKDGDVIGPSLYAFEGTCRPGICSYRCGALQVRIKNQQNLVWKRRPEDNQI